MSTNPNPTTPVTEDEDRLREHSYDGIQEFDKRLPNWWLFTLYGAIAFSFCYWLYNHSLGVRDRSIENLHAELNRIQMAKAASDISAISNEDLWKMTQDKAVVAAGAETFRTTCAACHGPDLKGNIGPNLLDDVWLHGGTPKDVVNTISKGVLDKGMPAWGPVLGDQRVLEAAAFVMSHHKPE